MIYLWLGLTVLLMGNRQSRVTWVGGIGLLLAALFFLCHGALVGAGVPGWACASGCLVAARLGCPRSSRRSCGRRRGCAMPI